MRNDDDCTENALDEANRMADPEKINAPSIATPTEAAGRVRSRLDGSLYTESQI